MPVGIVSFDFPTILVIARDVSSYGLQPQKGGGPVEIAVACFLLIVGQHIAGKFGVRIVVVFSGQIEPEVVAFDRRSDDMIETAVAVQYF